MFIFNSNSDDHSAFTTFAKVVMVLTTVISCITTLMSLLAFTKTRIGRHIRRNTMDVVMDFAEDSIDVTAERLPAIYKKMEAAGNKMEETMQ